MTHVNHRKKQFPLYIPTEYEPIWDELTEFALKSGTGRGVLLMECWNEYGEKIKHERTNNNNNR